MDCPGHLIGEKPCPTVPRAETIVFCVHGMGGSANSFEKFRQRAMIAKRDRVFFLSIVLKKDSTSAEVRNAVLGEDTINNRILFITLNFSDNRDYVKNQVQELYKRVEITQEVFGSSPKYSFMAHSKGGLVAIDYINTYGSLRQIDKIVTFGTPYHVQGLIDAADNIKLDKTVGDLPQHSAIKSRWNKSNYRIKVIAVATSIVMNTDTFVPIDSASGRGFVDFEGIIWNKPGNWNYEHSNMLHTMDCIDLVTERF